MTRKRNRHARAAGEQGNEHDRRDSGEPGGGQGRRDDIGGQTHIYPREDGDVPGDAEVRMQGSWGGGDYNEAGGSELVYRDGILLGGLTAGPDGEPTIDIHGGAKSEPEQDQQDQQDQQDRREENG